MTGLTARTLQRHMAIEEIEQRRDTLIQECAPAEKPSVLVSKRIHAGVRIEMGSRAAIFNDDLKGPIRIEEKMVQNATEMVAVNVMSQSFVVLPTENSHFNKED